MADEIEQRSPFDIDANDLWAEWIIQCKLTRQAGRAKADAKHAVAQAKASLKVKAAKIALDIRSYPEKYHLDKITEKSVEAALEVNGEYREMLAKVRRCEYEEDICSVDVTAFVDRRKALENLVQLLSIEYHGEREPKPLSQAANEMINDRRKKAIRATPKYREPETGDERD